MTRIGKIKSFPALLALGAMLAQANAAHAVTKNWLAGSGRWDNPAKWSPAGVPTAADDVVVSANGTYQLTYAAINSTINSLTVGGGTGVQTFKVGQNTLTINSASSVASTGVLLLNSSGTITGAGDISVAAGGTVNFSGGNLLGGSILTIANGATLNIDGTPKSFLRTINNSGTATWTGAAGVSVKDGAAFNNMATGTFTITMPSDGLMVNDTAGTSPLFTNAGTLTKTGVAASNFTNIGWSNSSSVTVSSGTFTVGQTGGAPAVSYTQSAGTTSVPAGTTLVAPQVSITGGSLTGAGTIDGALSNSGGTVNPGASPGILTVTGSYTQGTGGTLAIEIGGLTPGTEYDRLAVGANASLNGTLAITYINAFVPDPGNDNGCNGADGFQPVTYNSHSGTFATTSVPAGPIFFDATYSSSNLTLITNTTAPVVSSFSPSTGGPGTIVTITGRNFSAITGVTFNSVAANSFTTGTTTQFTATAPLGVTTGAIAVTNALGTSTTCSDFTADATAPSVAITTPANGSTTCDLSGGISGTSTDAETGISAVSITLRRARDGKFWNSSTSTWDTSATMIPATLGAGTWAVAAANLPPAGADTGIYNIWAFAFDNAGNLKTTRSNVGITCGVAALKVPAKVADEPSK